MLSLTVDSPAKLNLFLSVGNRRKDSYHNIITLFERIDLKDRVTLRVIKEPGIEIVSENSRIPRDETNLAYRAAALLRDEFKPRAGVTINIEKRIPVAAGLGGGSSNAAAVLMALPRMWRIRISRDRLIKLGRALGADVAFFLFRAPFALGEGAGDEIKVIRDIKHRFWHVLVVPDIEVSTRSIYEKFDLVRGEKLSPERLTKARSDVKILHNTLKFKRFALISKNLKNELGEVAAGYIDGIARAKSILRKAGVGPVAVSGSGPAVFSIVKSRKEAEEIKGRLDGLKGLRVFAAKTY
ncbi:MAG: 4-(cytidine 5'-diphospho)-2-C-methyl-D-erythritol kinase [Candidatus Omnitrophica bacterium]|nr:4-(cytidine 5'-diphospho)-2-C-methyl-D-erythritol kinase [Candidatus Omnitrophota bacterium]